MLPEYLDSANALKNTFNGVPVRLSHLILKPYNTRAIWMIIQSSEKGYDHLFDYLITADINYINYDPIRKLSVDYWPNKFINPELRAGVLVEMRNIIRNTSYKKMRIKIDEYQKLYVVKEPKCKNII